MTTCKPPTFNVRIFDVKHEGPLEWGGRPLSIDECAQELEVLWNEYQYHSDMFDPWCDGKPYENGVIFVVCTPGGEDKYDYYFGFKKRVDSDSDKLRFFIDGDVPDFIENKIEALSLALTDIDVERMHLC